MSIIGGANNTVLLPVTLANVSGIITSNLKAYYDAGRQYSYPKSGSAWVDLSGNGNNITFYNAGGTTYTTNPSGPPAFSSSRAGEFVFDGVNDWGKFTSYTSTANFSLSVWLKMTSTNECGLLSHCNGGPVGEAYNINNGKMTYWYYSSTWYTAAASSSINDGNWKNITYTRTGTTMKMYINGVLDFTTTLNANVQTSLACIGSKWGPCYSDSYGAGTDTYGTVFNGTIGAMLIYTKELSADEVAQNFNCLRKRFGI
jgi:hypothetical protein